MNKRTKCRIPMKLQFFAEGGAGEPAGTPGASGGAGQQQTQPSQQPPAIDYDKIQKMLEGTLSAKEDTALKAYFKQQGLTEEEVSQAIAAFKQQKAASQPDVQQLKQDAETAKAAAQKAQLESAATMMAVSLGMDAKTIPYVLKMADLSKVMGQDGKISEESLKTALNQVLEDVPALKPQAASTKGFVQIGATGGSQTTGGTEPLTLKGAISEALKK